VLARFSGAEGLESALAEWIDTKGSGPDAYLQAEAARRWLDEARSR
jgi:hypothetical protein